MPRLLIALVTVVFGTSFASRGQTTSPAAVDKLRTEVPPAKWLNISEALLLSAAVSLTVLSLQCRYGFNLGDEGWLWYISQRTALGDVPLRDFFSYDPGRYYWSAAVFKLLGRSGFFEQLLANYLFAIVGLALAYLAMFRAGLSRSWRILILLLLGVVLGFPRHKIYEQTLSLIAVAAIAFLFAAPQRFKRWLLLGFVIGLTAFVGRNSGVFCSIAAVIGYVLLRIRCETPRLTRVLAAVAGGIAIGYSPVLFMILGVHSFASPFWDSILMTPSWSWSLPIPFPWHVHLRGLHGLDLLQARAVSWLCVAVPVTYAFLLWRAARSRAELDGAEWLSVAASAAGVGFLVHAFYTSDFFHIAQGVVPFVIAAGAFSAHLWRTAARRWSVAVFCVLAFLILACWLPMEPLVQHLRTRHYAPASVEQIRIDGRLFEVDAAQAELMKTVETAFRQCGPGDGKFMEAPYYPGLYAFLNTRAPFWDTYYLWPRSDQVQQAHIDALQQSRTALILLNPESAMNGRESLELVRTNPRLVEYIAAHYQRADAKLPERFELLYSPQECRTAALTNP
ncbi:MAG: hypothetical protein JWN74_3311 [Acidobacteriaceae bacterium]|nr:hypothetical protein [Acidobacteriaceae bacterium]